MKLNIMINLQLKDFNYDELSLFDNFLVDGGYEPKYYICAKQKNKKDKSSFLDTNIQIESIEYYSFPKRSIDAINQLINKMDEEKTIIIDSKYLKNYNLLEQMLASSDENNIVYVKKALTGTQEYFKSVLFAPYYYFMKIFSGNNVMGVLKNLCCFDKIAFKMLKNYKSKRAIIIKFDTLTFVLKDIINFEFEEKVSNNIEVSTVGLVELIASVITFLGAVACLVLIFTIKTFSASDVITFILGFALLLILSVVFGMKMVFDQKVKLVKEKMIYNEKKVENKDADKNINCKEQNDTKETQVELSAVNKKTQKKDSNKSKLNSTKKLSKEDSSNNKKTIDSKFNVKKSVKTPNSKKNDGSKNGEKKKTP